MARKLSIKEAAEATGLSETELRAGFKCGKYPGMRLGNGNGKIIFDEKLLFDSIDEIMRSNLRCAN